MRYATPYNHFTHPRGRNFGTENTKASMTQKSDRDETDINIIVGRFMKTGQMPQITAQMITGDFTSSTDFRTMMDQLNHTKQQFLALPADLRKQFDNDPALFIDYANNPENREMLKKHGLLKPEAIKSATLDDVVQKLDNLKEPPNGNTAGHDPIKK